MLVSVFFLANDITFWYIVLHCMAVNHKQICSSDFLVEIALLSELNIIRSPSHLTYLISFLLQDVWLCGQADRQCYRKHVSPVYRDGPWAASRGNCQFHQQSDVRTTATQMRNKEILKLWISGVPGEISKWFWRMCVTTFLLAFVQVASLCSAVWLFL